MVLISKVDGVIVGVLPLLLTKKAGVQSAEFLFKFYFSPDFVFNSKHRSASLSAFLDYIFNKLGCRLVTFDLPADSQNLEILTRICDFYSVPVSIKNDTCFEHAVLEVSSSWDEFQKSKSSNFRHRFKSIEKKLSKAGQWSVSCFEDDADESGVLCRIMKVEEACWKQIGDKTIICT